MSYALLCLALQATALLVSADTLALEAQVGSTVTLPCPSSDETHRFQFWQLVGDIVVGPGNAINLDKYKYEVLTGELHIKAVSTSEAGFYKCVSKHVSGQGLTVQSVELVVRKDWEGEWETNHDANVYRGLLAVTVILGLIAIAVLLFLFYRRQRLINSITSMTLDEESPDEGPLRGTYNETTVPSTSTHHGIENPLIDTDFPSSFKTLQTTSAM